MRDIDTIYALSSGGLPAAIGIMRISGPKVADIAAAMIGGLPAPRRAVLRLIRHPGTKEVLDEALVLHFPAGESVTGEDLLELHCHGSRAVIAAVGQAMAGLADVRAAEAGEFTRRAFLNGRTDLARIEGLGDLLAAETEVQRRAALHMMEGRFSARVASWRDQLVSAAARVEAQIDFSDEADVSGQGEVAEAVRAVLHELSDALHVELARPSAERLRDGFRVVIAGPPNAGKSSLFNALVGREAAIVTPIPGTTRDLVEAPLGLDGLPLLLVDSAGLRNETNDAVEAIGIGRAEAAAAEADILLWMGAPTCVPETRALVIQIFGKADLPSFSVEPRETEGIALSTVRGDGLDHLIARLIADARTLAPRPDGYALSDRQRMILQRILSAIDEALLVDDEILLGELLRSALARLAELTGENATEAMLDHLFTGFCIGK